MTLTTHRPKPLDSVSECLAATQQAGLCLARVPLVSLSFANSSHTHCCHSSFTPLQSRLHTIASVVIPTQRCDMFSPWSKLAPEPGPSQSGPAHQSSLLLCTSAPHLISSPTTQKLPRLLESNCCATTARCTCFHYGYIMTTEGLILALRHLTQYLTDFQIFAEQNFTRVNKATGCPLPFPHCSKVRMTCLKNTKLSEWILH